MFGWFLLTGFIISALVFNSWWWVAVVLFGIWKAGQWYFYNGRSWRRIHYPMMHAYAAAAGFESGLAESEGREFDIELALSNMLRATQPGLSEEQIRTFINREYKRCAEFEDVTLLKAHIKRKNPNITEKNLENLLERIRKIFNPNDNGIMIRMVIAGTVEDQYGETDRAEYLFEVLIGNAK